MENVVDDADMQGESSKYEHLKAWQFKKGQSGNPGGKKPGTVSLKTFAKNYIQGLTDEEKLEFLEGIDKKTVWEMSEGKPKQDTDITSGGQSLTPLLVKFLDADEPSNGDTKGV